jgi:predicted RNA-binding Zn-ribbon protein involved in translation (DUF1610 family)
VSSRSSASIRGVSGFHNKYLKQQHALMAIFEYELTGWSKRTGGHPIYERDGFDRLELSCTPRNEKAARGRLLNTLRKRHPEHPMWRSARKRRSQRPASREQERKQASATALINAAARERSDRPAVVRPERTSCVSCGRPWLSDLDFVGRPCPACGGEIVGGRRAA